MSKNRRAVIADSRKMNKTVTETTALIEAHKPLVGDADCGVVVCPPFTSIQTACDAARSSNIKVGAQNVHFAESGSYILFLPKT